MRSILVLLVMLAAVVVGGWLGGETLLARSANRLIASDPRIAAAGVTEMRDAQRLGVRIDTPRFDDPAQGLAVTADWLDLWVTPRAPSEIHIGMAPATGIAAAGRQLALGAEGAQALLRFSPTRGMALGEAEITARGLTLDSQPALDGVTLHAELAGYGDDSPAGTGAAYQVNGAVQGLDLARLSGGAQTGLAGASGAGRVWLSKVPVTAGDIASGAVGPTPPVLIGLRADGVDVTLDGLQARIYGRLLADAQGLAEGQVLIDTADAQGFVDRAVAAGAVPGGLGPMVMAALSAAARQQAEAEAAAAAAADEALGAPDAAVTTSVREVDDLPAHVAPPQRWPPVRDGQLRIPLNFAAGKVSLGTLPLGDAPRLRPPAGS